VKIISDVHMGIYLFYHVLITEGLLEFYCEKRSQYYVSSM